MNRKMNVAVFAHKTLAFVAVFSMVMTSFGASVALAEDTTEPIPVVSEEVVVEDVETSDVVEEVVEEEVVEEDVETSDVVEEVVEEEVVEEDVETSDVVEEVVEEEVVEEEEVVNEPEVVEEILPQVNDFTPEISLFRFSSDNSNTDEASVCTDEPDGDWSDNVVSTTQAKRKDGSEVLPERSFAESALNNMPVVDSTGFYSLGFGGSMIVSFDKYVVNFALGTDLTVFETTNLTNPPYPTETAMVEVSQDGLTWVFAGLAVDAGGNYFNLDSVGLDWIKFVRITDTSDSELFPNDADGFDVSAVFARQSVCNEPQEPTFTIGGYKWNDLDADGIWDENEPKLPNWTIKATENEDTATPVQYEDVTDEDGYYSIEVPAGSWIVSEVNQEGWEQTAPSDPKYCLFTLGEQITLTALKTLDGNVCNFGNHQIEVPQCVADVNLIQNGSFETPDLPVDGFGWDIFDSVSSGLAWVVEWLHLAEGSPVPAKLELQSGFYTAADGVQYAELDSNWNNAPGGPYFGEDTRVRVSQTIDTIPGQTYRVSYDFSPLPRHNAQTNILSVLLDGNEVANHSADGTSLTDTDWNTYTYNFVATGTESVVGFADAGAADSFGTLLDNVSVNCVPAVVVEEEIPTNNSSHGGGGGRRAVPKVAGESTSVADPKPQVLGEQVSIKPYGAPSTGHGGTSSSQSNSLSLSQLLIAPRRTTILK